MSTKIYLKSLQTKDLKIENGVLFSDAKEILPLKKFHSFIPTSDLVIQAIGARDYVEIHSASLLISQELLKMLRGYEDGAFSRINEEKEERIKLRSEENLENKYKLFQNTLKTKYANELNLRGLKEVQKEENNLWLFFEEQESLRWLTGYPQAEIDYAYGLLLEHLEKIQVLKIFKDLQNANPFTSPSTLWVQARETYQLLKEQGIETHY